MSTARIAGFAGLTAVALGAFGAHALKERLAATGMGEVWHTAVLYHLVHAVALLALSFAPQPLSKARRVARFSWTLGLVLFSGSLYLLALGAPRWTGAITPLGGLTFLTGWTAVIISGWQRKENHS